MTKMVRKPARVPALTERFTLKLTDAGAFERLVAASASAATGRDILWPKVTSRPGRKRD